MKACLSVTLAVVFVAAPALALNRPVDPVVFTGADVPSLTGLPPANVVAFRYDGGWQQIPVQVDERAVVDFDVARKLPPGGYQRLDYTDAGTFTGADPNPMFDADDEIVFMAADAGQQPPEFSEPAGVIPCSGVEVLISDPLGSAPGYVYLFRQDGSLDPGAGVDYVDYQYNLLSGDYKTSFTTGLNPEDSTCTTDYYQVHFEAEWMQDGLRIFAGSATGADILDMHKNKFAPGECVRTVYTFSEGGGAFIANRDGPVRAIRSYFGTNSGPYTQRQHIYYAQREDIGTFLRVHDIGGVMDFMDYSPEASGMVYHNNHNTSGVVIDGVPDTVTEGPVDWELIEGAHGSLVIAARLDTDIPDPSHTSYYFDDHNATDTTQCTGDAHAYGSSGMWVNHAIPNTDPILRPPPVYRFEVYRTLYYEAPGLTVADAELRKAYAKNSLVPTFNPWVEFVFDDVPCGYWAQRQIEAIYREGITGGCTATPPQYCPASDVTRAQMAVFICRAAGQTWLDPGTATFTDVPRGDDGEYATAPFSGGFDADGTHWAYGWIERLADPASWGGTALTGGCGGGRFCPSSPTTRGQMAVFLCKANGKTWLDPGAPTFGDVPEAYPFYGWIERLADPGSWTTPPTSGCAPGPPRQYCPTNSCRRDQMAVFLSRAFDIPY